MTSDRGGEIGAGGEIWADSTTFSIFSPVSEVALGEEILIGGIGGSGDVDDVDFFDVSLLDVGDFLGFLVDPVGLASVGVVDLLFPFDPLLLFADVGVDVGVGVVADRFLFFLPTGFFFSFFIGSDIRGPANL